MEFNEKTEETIKKLSVDSDDIEQLLNEVLNDALCTPKRIRKLPTNSNEIAKWVTNWLLNRK